MDGQQKRGSKEEAKVGVQIDKICKKVLRAVKNETLLGPCWDQRMDQALLEGYSEHP
jgi:hypothetical protein